MRRVIESVAVGRPTPPLITPAGVQVIFVCEGIAPAASGPSRNEVMDQLARERIDMLARRYMRDLQRAALIEVRQ